MKSQEVRHNELTFQLIVESSPNAIVLVNKEGKIAYVNNQTEKLFGYPRSELIGRMVEMLLPKRYTQKHPEYRESFFSSPSVRSMGAGRELFAIRKDNTEFPIEIGLNPVVTVEGTLVLASIIDITERKKAEERVKLVVESAPNAMVLISTAGIITLVNRQTEMLFGYERSELIGNKLETLIPERFRSNHPGHRTSFFQKPQTRSMGAGRDLFARRKDGTEIQVEIGLNPIETPEGQVVLASIIDITERKLQETNAKKQVALEIRNKELEQFAYLASHDLQEPLRTVSNYIYLLKEDYSDSLNEGAFEYLKSIEGATVRMSILVKALLDFSRLGRNKRLVSANLQDLVREVTEDMHTTIHSANAEITVMKMPTLFVYEAEVRQLFQNLISNAIKFQLPGKKPVIRIDAAQLTNKWKFTVTDNGIGIAPNHYARIFDIFQRLHTVDEYEGNGIGLANCKKIAELHNGEIWVESREGEGSSFNFTIADLRDEAEA
ncbi:MAG TPA: PAS domain S-box protein [Cyclobacteriaceae bacterium]|nr:PAS domain S-box protein [Cyclobacteriaceae bacterium]